MNEIVKLPIIEQNLKYVHTILEKANIKPKLFLTLKRSYELLNVSNISYFAYTIENKIPELVDGFIFETLSDAIIARMLGVKKRIILLYYITSDEAELASKHSIEITCPCINWLDKTLQMFPNIILKTHVYLDMGIGRQGLTDESELIKLIEKINNTDNIQLNGIGTRFNSESNGVDLNEGLWIKSGIPIEARKLIMDNLISHQKYRFNNFIDKLKKLNIITPNILIHAACSKEIINEQTDVFYDMVRVGRICLSTLFTNLSIKVPVLSIKSIPKNFCLGYYGKSGRTSEEIKVAYIKFYKFLDAKYYYNDIELKSINVSDPFGLIVTHLPEIEIGSIIEIKPNLIL
jgi:hypothetical protein